MTDQERTFLDGYEALCRQTGLMLSTDSRELFITKASEKLFSLWETPGCVVLTVAEPEATP